MAKKGKPVDNIKDGLAKLLAASAKSAARETKTYRTEMQLATDTMNGFRYIDFIDVNRKRPCLPLEWVHGTRGLLTGKLINYLADPAVGKSSMIMMNCAMAQASSAWCCIGESEDTPPPPDWVEMLGCKPTELIFQYPQTVEQCFDGLEAFCQSIRDTGIDNEGRWPIVLGIDSVGGLGVDNIINESLKDESGGKGQGAHARLFSKFFRERMKMFKKADAVLCAASQLKENIDMFGGGGSKETTIANNPLEFHSTWRMRMSQYPYRVGTDKTSPIVGSIISMLCRKNKLAPAGRNIKAIMRKLDFQEGPNLWDFDLANKELLFGPESPFSKLGQSYKSSGGWYSHELINSGKNLRLEDFIDQFYENEAMVQECREALRIRGFGFDFENGAIIEDVNHDEDDLAEILANG